MPLHISRYEFSPEDDFHYDEAQGLALSRRSTTNRSWFIWPSPDRAKAGEDRFAHFFTAIRIDVASGLVYDGGAMTVVTPSRVIALLNKGTLRTPEGVHELAEERGSVASANFAISDIGSSTIERNWRGKPKEIALRGRDDDPFAYVLEEVWLRVSPDQKGARTDADAFLAVFEEGIEKKLAQ